MIAIMFCLPGCTSAPLHDYSDLQHRRAMVGLSPEQNKQITAAIARDVRHAYESLDSLSLTAEPEWPGGVRARIHQVMTRGMFKTQLYVDGQLAYVMTLRDGLIEEKKLACRGVGPAYEVRPADDEFGTHNVNQLDGIDEFGCMMGGHCATWVGRDSPKEQFFTTRIRLGEYLGTAQIRGQTCRLVLCQPTPRYGGIELFSVRPDGLVQQWDTFQPGESAGPPKFIRTRPYSDIDTTTPPRQTWQFEEPSRVEAWKRRQARGAGA